MSSPGGVFDIYKQFTFYGAYHNHPVNVLVHITFVPLILCTFQVMASYIPMPSFIPEYHLNLGDYLVFDLNVASIHAILYLAYYFMLEPVAALLYAPQLTLSVLTAIAYSYSPDAFMTAVYIHVVSWIAQFFSHAFAEKRAPALLDNLIGAVVLAPFFVHLEVLFKLGYKPELHHEIKRQIDIEISKIRKQETQKQ